MKVKRENCGDQRHEGHVVSKECRHAVVSATTEPNTRTQKKKDCQFPSVWEPHSIPSEDSLMTTSSPLLTLVLCACRKLSDSSWS